ncbi:MAG: GMC family oxidoreductase [Burkholderiaceae bacterium]
MPSVEFDHVIVGAGTAGCLLANRLSADPARRVLLIEAGGSDNYHWIHIPVGYLYCIGNPRTDWLYQTEADAGLNGRKLRYPRGKTLGGCSSINGMIYMRGQARDYDGWATLTSDPSWTWDRCLPYFKKHEDHFRGADEMHGAGGEWRVERQRLRWDILEAFAQAAQQAGIPASDDFNRGDNEGVGYFLVNQKNGWRWSAARAFLRPTCAGRSNFELWTSSQVVQLLVDRQADGSKRCTGAKVWNGKELVTVRATGEVILSAGSIGSPQILQLSGVGPGALLQQHGISVLHEMPGVGENLQDHLQLRMAFKVKNVVTLNQRVHSLFGKAAMGLEYALFRSGPLTMAPSQLGGFTRSSPQHPTANVEIHTQPLSLDKFGDPLHPFNAFTSSVCNLRPTSRGYVRIKSPDPRAAPAIHCRYLSTDEDRRVAIDSLRLTRRIAAQPALARFEPDEFLPGSECASDAEIVKAAGNIGTTIFHPVSTCRMGSDDDAGAVVDSRLRVRGLGGLRIVDASVMPTITSGNTNSPTLMIAEKAAAMIREDRRR